MLIVLDCLSVFKLPGEINLLLSIHKGSRAVRIKMVGKRLHVVLLERLLQLVSVVEGGLEAAASAVRAHSGALLLLRVRGGAEGALGIGDGVVTEDAVDGAEERVLLAAALVAEVVEVERPDHAAAEALLLDELGLLADDVDVVEADPLVAVVGDGAHGALGVLLHGPALLADVLADLRKKEGEVSW